MRDQRPSFFLDKTFSYNRYLILKVAFCNEKNTETMIFFLFISELQELSPVKWIYVNIPLIHKNVSWSLRAVSELFSISTEYFVVQVHTSHQESC